MSPTAKIALRDLRKNRWLTLVSVLVIALPVTFMIAMIGQDTGAVSVETFPDGRQANATYYGNYSMRQNASGTEAASFDNDTTPPIDGALVNEITAIVSPNTVDLTINDQSGSVSMLAVRGPNGSEPILIDTYSQSGSSVTHGKVPRQGEIALSEEYALLLGAKVGDKLDRVIDDELSSRIVVSGLTDGPTIFRESKLDLVTATREDLGSTEVTVAINGAEPVMWDQVKELNDLGIVVKSQAVINNPPSDQEIHDYLQAGPAGSGWSEMQNSHLAWLVLVAGVILVGIILLITPAFTAHARRNERALAQLAAVGASPRQLRSVMLWQGIVVGSIGAILGVIIYVICGSLLRTRNEFFVFAPWWAAVSVAVGAIVFGLIAALFPARVASKVDVVAVTSGRDSTAELVSPRRRKSLIPLLVTIGVAVVMLVKPTDPYSYGFGFVEVILIFIGILAAVLTIPGVVNIVQRLFQSGNLPARLAAREASAGLHRTGSSAAALAMLTALGVGLLSYGSTIWTRSWDRQFQIGKDGAAIYELSYIDSGGDGQEILNAGLYEIGTLKPIDSALTLYGPNTSFYGSQSLAIAQPEEVICPAHKEFDALEVRNDESWAEIQRKYDDDPRCHQSPKTAPGPMEILGNQYLQRLVAGPEIVDVMHTIPPEHKAEARKILADGGALVYEDYADWVIDGSLTYELYQSTPYLDANEQTASGGESHAQASDPEEDWKPERTVTVASLPVIRSQAPIGGEIISPKLAEELGLDVTPVGALIDFKEPLTAKEVSSAGLSDTGSTFGYVNQANVARYSQLDGISKFLSFFIIVAVAISAGVIFLSSRAARPNLDTIDAVGAKPSFRRQFSTSLGVIISLSGVLPGLIVGIVGVAILRRWEGIAFDFPLLWIALFAMTIVAIAALLGTLLPPRRISMTRRTD